MINYICYVLLPLITLCWDKTLHDRIGESVTSVLANRDMEDLHEYLKGKSLSWMSRYAHDNLQYAKFDRTVENHYETQSRNWQCTFNVDNPSESANKGGLYETVNDIFGRICHQQSNIYNDTQGIAKDKTEQIQLSWLMGLIQDMHQPLHLGFGSDDHGRRINVEYHGNHYNLYDFWEKEISQSVNLDSGSIRQAYINELNRMKHDGASRNMKLVKELYQRGLAMWIDENMRIACYEIYATIAGGGGREVPKSFIINDNVYNEWRRIAAEQAIKSAARTAVILHAVAIHVRTYHPEQTGLYKRSSSVKHRIRDNWHIALLKNIGIAAIVVPILMVLLNTGLNLSIKDILKRGKGSLRNRID